MVQSAFLMPILYLGFLFLIGYYITLLLGSKYEATETKIVDKMILYYAAFVMLPLSAWATISARYGDLSKYAWLYKTISDMKKQTTRKG